MKNFELVEQNESRVESIIEEQYFGILDYHNSEPRSKLNVFEPV